MNKIRDALNTILDKSLPNRIRGDAMEYIATETIDNNDLLGITAKQTKGSGSVHGNGDIHYGNIMFDCKIKGKNTSVSIPFEDINKVDIQAREKGKIGAIITPIINDKDHINPRLFVTMELPAFIQLLGEGCTPE